MNLKEIKELVEFLKEQDIAEFEMERGDVKVRIKRAGGQVSIPETRIVTVAPVQPAASDVVIASAGSIPVPPAVMAAPPAATPEEGLHIVRSPIVGTFYESPSPGSPPFVRPGDVVTVGQILCIVEAMKLMNEIESDVAGEVVKKLVANGAPIEYGQELFAIRSRS